MVSKKCSNKSPTDDFSPEPLNPKNCNWVLVTLNDPGNSSSALGQNNY